MAASSKQECLFTFLPFYPFTFKEDGKSKSIFDYTPQGSRL